MSDVPANNFSSGNLVSSGSELVADFQSAIANLVTMETAKYAAKQSENEAIRTIETVSSNSNGVFVTPGDIQVAAQQSLLRSSLDTHIKKVQAQQIESFTAAQISAIEQKDSNRFCGKKVHIAVADSSLNPIESYWYDDRSGQESRGVIKAKSVKGTLEEISFSKNLLIIKPLLASRMILSSRKYFVVSVINPQTLMPLVNVRFL